MRGPTVPCPSGGSAGLRGRPAHKVAGVDKQEDTARKSVVRRAGTALAGLVLAAGLVIPLAPATAQPLPDQPAPQVTVSATDEATGSTDATGSAGQDGSASSSGSAGATSSSTRASRGSGTNTSTVANRSLSRRKTIAALIGAFVVALLASLLVFRRSGKDNSLG